MSSALSGGSSHNSLFPSPLSLPPATNQLGTGLRQVIELVHRIVLKKIQATSVWLQEGSLGADVILLRIRIT